MGMWVVNGLTLNFLLKINITSFKDLVLKAKNSVIPLNFPLRNVVFEIGPLIKANEFFFLRRLSPILNDLSMYSFFYLMRFFFAQEEHR